MPRTRVPANPSPNRARIDLLRDELAQDDRWRQNLRKRLRRFGGLTFYGAEAESIIALTHLRTLRAAEAIYLEDPDAYAMRSADWKNAANELARINALAERVEGNPERLAKKQKRGKQRESSDGRMKGLIPDPRRGKTAKSASLRQPR